VTISESVVVVVSCCMRCRWLPPASNNQSIVCLFTELLFGFGFGFVCLFVFRGGCGGHYERQWARVADGEARELRAEGDDEVC
jgi:hypothetical protein